MAPAKPAFTGPDLCALSAREVIALLQKRAVSAPELVEASLARQARTSPVINAMVTPCADRARSAARIVRTDSALAGLPIGIKDLTPVQGVRSTYGTPALSDFIPEASDPLVTRLERRGGIVMGKTNTPEMGAGGNTFNAVFGPTRNPWDTRMNAGGSSGGAAAGLAAGEVWLSQGSDLGGSLRTPASFCGIVGLRPSPGVAGGGHPLMGFDTTPVEGPMARNVADCALFLDAMAGFHSAWPGSFPAPETSYLATCLQDAGPVRVAFAPDLGGLGPVTPEMQAHLRGAMDRLNGNGIDVEDAAPRLDGVDQCFRHLRAFAMWTAYRHAPKAMTDHYKPTLRQNIEDGRAITLDQLGDAQVTRARLYDTMRQFLETFDVIACPVTGIGALPVEVEYPTEIAGVASHDYLDWLRFAFPATLCGLPALSLPVGRDPRGIPVGLQLIGQPRGEARLLQIARTLEERLGGPMTPIDPVIRHT
jgi:amidase